MEEQMKVSYDEAQASLAAIREISQQTRRALAAGGGAYILILWGIIWFLGFLASQFLDDLWVGWTWAILDMTGGILSWVIARRMNQQFRSALYSRLGLFWLALIGYGALWIGLALPLKATQAAMLIITICMFGYVVMGLWLEMMAQVWVGLIVTGLALLGYYGLPSYFYLWMAILGGGTLIGSGVYILRYWK